MCESTIKGQSNRATGKISFMHKVLSPVQDFSINVEMLQYQYGRWLFKTITGAINSKFSGCSPNTALQDKCFSAIYWNWQHLYLIDAVRQYGFPSFFITISPYEWTFPWPPFLKQLREQYGKEPTDVPILETLHVSHVLEQLARGYLAGANTNRWRNQCYLSTFLRTLQKCMKPPPPKASTARTSPVFRLPIPSCVKCVPWSQRCLMDPCLMDGQAH